MGRDIPKVLDDDEQAALLGACNTRYTNGVKNRAMMLTMLNAGLRVSEVSSLRLSDVDMSEGCIHVVDGKGDRDRKVWFNGELRDALSGWLEVRPSSSEGWMFPTRNGTATSPRSVRRTVKRYAERAGIDWWESVSPHTLRHTFATDLYRETGNIRLVQKALGHADISTTMIYTHIVDDELEGAMKALRRNVS